MGLDQVAHVYENGQDFLDQDKQGEELACWRKHPFLQGWMEQLWEDKGRPNFDSETMGGTFGDFNCVPLKLTIEDIDRLEKDINANSLPETEGCFFGDDSCDDYKEEDLKFIEDARKALSEGKIVVYNSWW